MTDAFGAGPVRPACGSGLSTPQEDMDLSRAALTAIHHQHAGGPMADSEAWIANVCVVSLR